MSVEARRRTMSRIRAKHTTPERHLAQLLIAAGIEFEQHSPDLPGKPDFVFRQQKVAVFVDGDFWHGWRFPVWQHRLSPAWREKIAANRQRDAQTRRKLRQMAWTAVRIWEHQVEADILNCIRRIVDTLSLQNTDWDAIRRGYSRLAPLKRRNRLPRP